MINIIIDGNYFFHKTFGIFAGYGDINPEEKLSTQEDRSMFIRKVATDLCYSLRNLPRGGRFIFTIDGKSWRKDYFPEYKIRREEKRDDNKKWKTFFTLLREFGNHLSDTGFIFSESEGSEGDDLIWGWVEYFKNNGENSIIVSGDGDLHQLVDMREDGSWTIAWNSKSKGNLLSINSKWIDEYLNKEEEVTIFNLGDSLDSYKKSLTELLNKSEVNLVERDKFIFTKILSGDKGDDVPAVWQYRDTPESRLTRVTENKASKIWDLLLESEWKNLGFVELMENEDFLYWVSGQCIKIIKGIDSDSNREKASENLIRNFDLMWLSESSYPPYVLSGIREEISRGIKTPKKEIKLNMNDLLEGTSWVTKDGGEISSDTPSQYDPFKLF